MHFLAYLLLCLMTAILGSKRNLGFWGYFLLSLVATPFVSLIVLVIGGHKKAARVE